MADQETKAKCMEFLMSRMTAVIATASSAGKPAASTIYFTIGEDFIIYFMTKKFTHKYQSLENNQEVALVIGRDNEPVTAQIFGVAEKITDANEFTKRFEQLQKKYFENNYVAPLFQLHSDKNELVMYKIRPLWIQWLDLRQGEQDGDFVQIL